MRSRWSNGRYGKVLIHPLQFIEPHDQATLRIAFSRIGVDVVLLNQQIELGRVRLPWYEILVMREQLIREDLPKDAL